MYVKEVINLWIQLDVFVFFLRKVKQNATVLKNQGRNSNSSKKSRA